MLINLNTREIAKFKGRLQSLQVVISLFNEADKADVTPIEEKATTPQVQSVSENSLFSQTDKDKLPITTSVASASTQRKKTVSSSKKSQTRKTQISKTAKKSPGWQQYLRSEFRNSSLPQAISSVLHAQPDRVWDINAVAEAIFVEQIPVEVKKKVRLQITNLLAQGARENKWHRGQQGSYTLSGQAAKSQLIN
jgi:hypothetical protein